MTPELLTEQELAILSKGLADTVIISHPEIAVTAKLLSAYEALVLQVAELTAERAVVVLMLNEALATEKAAHLETKAAKLRELLIEREAKEAAEKQVAELEKRLELEGQKWLAAEADIATEKAAREAETREFGRLYAEQDKSRAEAYQRIEELTESARREIQTLREERAAAEAAREAAERLHEALFDDNVALRAKLERVMGILYWLRQYPGATAQEAGDKLDEALR